MPVEGDAAEAGPGRLVGPHTTSGRGIPFVASVSAPGVRVDQNITERTMTIDRGKRSGTVDVTLSDNAFRGPELHVTGSWRC